MYTTVKRVLVSRNIDCSSITCDEFVKALFSDILAAEEQYNDQYIPEWVASNVLHMKQSINSTKNYAINYANKKWKTERKRNEYISNIVKNAINSYVLNSYYETISFFDFDVNPGSNSISNDCCLSISKLTFNSLIRCFNQIKDNKYFKHANGWRLTYTSMKDSFRNLSRPQIELIVDDDTKNEMDNDRDCLTKAINEFYKGCTYFGD